MRKIYSGFLVVLSLIVYPGCQQRSSWENQIDGMHISWELISNFTGESGQFEAKFTFENNSGSELGNTGWKLFFNMSPRPILPYPEESIAKITHLNGDWYSLTPGTDFKLPHGEQLSITYTGTEGIIKETDAPMGLYFVFYNEQGEEKEILPFSNFSVVPFTRDDQLLRGDMDFEIPSSPAKWYEEFSSMTLLSEEQLPLIVPTPYELQKGVGTFSLQAGTAIYFEKGLEVEASYLADKLKALTGTTFAIKEGAEADAAIQLSLASIQVGGKSKEAYELMVNEKGVSIQGADAAGVFYGVQSLLALLGPSTFLNPTLPLQIPQVRVKDAPRFHFRSLHLDVSRNFQNKETILRLLDMMSHYKLNHFLFYTTEDEGWRLEIDGLPELTEVGAQRQHVTDMNVPALHPAYGSGPFPYMEGKHGSGFYSREDFIEILNYAKKRHITIIPELNFPGHARAAIRAMEARYEKYMKDGDEEAANEYRLIDPDDTSEYLSAQAFKDNTVSVARESTYRFYEKVMDEIAKMYHEAGLTLTKIHAGGDEVPEGAWTASPMAADLLRQLPDIDDPKNLQAYFFRELLKRLEKLNVEVHVWEEMALMKTADGSYVPNPEFVGKKVIPYIWNNMFDYPDLGYQLANAGYEVVLCNVSNFYFDLAYTNDPKEPGLYWAGFVNTKNSWTFAPFDWFKTTFRTSMGEQIDTEEASKGMVQIRPDAKKNIIGVEAQLWSETIKGREMVEYYTFPKIIGFAESGWARERSWENQTNVSLRNTQIQEGWNAFANAIAQREYPKLAKWNEGYVYRIAAPGAKIENGMVYANVEFPGLEIRYTLDGSEPDNNASIYTAPFSVAGSVKLKAFDRSGNSSSTVQVSP
jgi:hexosaminidase